MNQFQPLPNTIVGTLPLHDYQTRYTTSVAAVALRFEQAPQLPGVIVMDGRVMVGVLSRAGLERCKSDPSEALPRDLQVFLPALPPMLEVPDTCPIPIAVERALQRSECYEPIVVTFRDGSRRLLAMQALLQAMLQMFDQIYQMSQYQQVHIQGSAGQLQQAQQRITAMQQAEAVYDVRVKSCQLALQQAQGQLQEQQETVAMWQQRLAQVQGFCQRSQQQVWQSITAAVETISHRTTQMAVIGRAIAQELEYVHNAATVTKKLSDQSRFLGLRAAVLASRLNAEAEGWGEVTHEFNHLSDQARKTAQQLDETADRIKTRLADLAKLAQMGAHTTHNLVDQAVDVSKTLVEMENSLTPPTAGSGSAPAQDVGLPEARSLRHKAQHVDQALLELEQLVK
jgi:hypothetical protein